MCAACVSRVCGAAVAYTQACVSHTHKLVYRIYRSLCVCDIYIPQACVSHTHKLVYCGCAAPLSQPVRMHARMHVCVHTYCLHARTHACMYTCVRACVHVAGVQHAAVAAREAALAHTGPHSPHTQCARTEEITRGYSRRGIHGCDTARTRSRAAGGGVPQTCTRPTHTSAFLDGPPVHPDGPACCDGLPQGPHRRLLTPSEAAIHP